MASIKVPITNVFGDGDYTAPIKIGSTGVTANVILDTGSSSLAVKSSVYDPGADDTMKPTTLAQDFIYGSGAWTGPVVEASIAMGSGAQEVSAIANLGITVDYEPGNFGNADGIMGLAFNYLNSAYDLSSYITEQRINPPWTYPWPFRLRNSTAAIRQFASFLNRVEQHDLQPYFSALAAPGLGVERNIFALYTLRSTVAMGTANPATDPLNNGYFILGGGEEQADLYVGDFIDVNVIDDFWYNTKLEAVQVAGFEQIDAKPLDAKYAKSYISNSIIDSGTNILNLAADVYQAIFSSLKQVNAGFAHIIEQPKQPVPADDLDLAQWPDITFILAGANGGQATLTCTPSNYWQLDSPAAGQAMFQIENSHGVQSVLGLPLLNNYYTVFDRSQNPYGMVRFAKSAPPA